jgi:hypothetical protein
MNGYSRHYLLALTLNSLHLFLQTQNMQGNTMFGASLRYGIMRDQATSARLHSYIEGCKSRAVEAVI